MSARGELDKVLNARGHYDTAIYKAAVFINNQETLGFQSMEKPKVDRRGKESTPKKNKEFVPNVRREKPELLIKRGLMAYIGGNQFPYRH